MNSCDLIRTLPLHSVDPCLFSALGTPLIGRRGGPCADAKLNDTGRQKRFVLSIESTRSHLTRQRADILVTREGLGGHPHSGKALDDLAIALGAQIVVHGHPRVWSDLPQGWADVADRLFADLVAMLEDAAAEYFKVIQIKEKDAGLRVYWELGNVQTLVLDIHGRRSVQRVDKVPASRGARMKANVRAYAPWRYALCWRYPHRPCAGPQELAAGAPCPAELLAMWTAGGDHGISIDFGGSAPVRRWSDKRKGAARRRSLS